MPEAKNSFAMLVRYFGEKEHVSMTELKAFWDSCSEEDKKYFRCVDLETGLLND